MMGKKILTFLNYLSGIICIITGVIITLEIIFSLNTENTHLYTTLHSFFFKFLITDLSIRLLVKKNIKFLLSQPADLLVFFPLIENILNLTKSPQHLFLTQIILIIIIIGRLKHTGMFFRIFKLKPAQMLLTGFLFAIFTGSLLLSLPVASVNEHLPYMDALFTAVSAVCVTGLVVNDIGTTFTLFGQIIILLLIQIGGLGIMTFSVLLTMILNKKISQRETQEFQQNYATFNLKDTFRTIRAIFIFTFIFEIAGSILLFIFWRPDFESVTQAMFSSLFHSVSAFCNAGFSLFPDSFVRYSTATPIIMTISVLIIFGGIGFPVIINLYRYMFHRRKNPLIKLHTKITLTVTAVLLVFGTLIILFSEYNNALSSFNIFEKGLISFFHSVSARTCGFNSIDLNLFGPASLLIIISLMYIGASPGSTGGGIKTTTVGIFITACISTFRAQNKTEIAGRTIAREDILKALAIVILSALIILFFLFNLLLFEDFVFFETFFETVSAFGTAGLSLGTTRYLSIYGKMFIMIIMFIGRVGPLTVAYALAREKSKSNYAYPEESVLIA
ncbi:MAG: hypothetical protein GY730_02285 [bacterium]|nr:hypothetical protein [bacterium]